MMLTKLIKVQNRKHFLHFVININKKHWSNSRLSATSTDILNIENEKFQKYLESLRKEFYILRANPSRENVNYRRMTQLSDVVKVLEEYRALKGNMPSENDIETEQDEDMKQLIKEEADVYKQLINKTQGELLEQMLTLADGEYYPSLIFEVNAGAGGQEAMLFARDLYNMYIKYFDNNNWDYEVIDEDITDLGGLRYANVVVNDEHSYKFLRYEAGVHRVQRIPATEKSGRIHTSTASVAVIPKPTNVNITIADKDLKIETKRASGAGGQHVNTTDSAVRIVHVPTGIAIECQSERSQLKNKQIALKKLHLKLMHIELESLAASTKSTRKSQQGNLNRNEKIRTYNYAQDRITDHRINGGTVHNLREFLEGGEQLDSFIQQIAKEFRKKLLLQMVENLRDEEIVASKKN